ncbi:MAG: molybdopterin-dependent oxidoreductase, partial [Thermodesulfobacteriota bacterium]
LCPRGLSGIMLLYDPNRVNVPLKRTNPEKGIGIDPGWKEISWEEALTVIAEKLKKILKEDPRKLLMTTSVVPLDALRLGSAFASAFGTPNWWESGAGPHCGNGEHLIGGMVQAAWARQPDTDHMKYFLNFGTPAGFGAYYAVTTMAQRMAEARVRGLRHVVIDPWMGMAAEKADQWIPIRPGTDAALALAMINVLLNELGICDVDSIKHHTNGPYLIGPDGYYVRDKETGKPLIWDPLDKEARVYDDPETRDYALEGQYDVQGTLARPAFALIKEHVKQYTPEMAADITTVSAVTIRRLAKEFGEAACIGSTIVIDGKELPYRPVGVGYFKGPQGHRHSALTCIALELLSEVVGASGVPGGMVGQNSRSLGCPDSGHPCYTPKAGLDGFLETGTWSSPTRPYPLAEARVPQSYRLQELVPTACITSPLVPLVLSEPERFHMSYRPEFHFQVGSNYLMTSANPLLVERAFKDIFTVSCSIYLDESTELADIVLPDACYLERQDIWPATMNTHPPLDFWTYQVRQPVIGPLYQRRSAQEVMLDIAERVGMLPDFYTMINLLFEFREPYLLDPKGGYTWEEIVDRKYKSTFGPEHGLEWFKKNSPLSWPKKTEEVYWRPFIKARVPIYFELFKEVGQQIEQIKKELDITEAFDTSDFQPLPDWKPCQSHLEERSEFDLFAIYYRVPFQTFSFTYNIPWLDEISRMDPFVYHIAINKDIALGKGINDGDWVEVESADTKNKVKARARLTEGIHPEVIAVANCGGHWSKHLPIASQPGKGVCFEWLMA